MVEAPPPWALYYFGSEIQRFVRALEASWYLAPWTPTSWWRSQNSNLAAGGNRYSQHLIALAVDAQPIGGASLRQLQAAFEQQGLVAVRYQTHVHAQLWEAGRLEKLFA